MKTFAYIVMVIIAIIAAITTWKFSPYFLSRRDRYRNSAYEIVRIKFIWSVTAFGAIIIYGIVLIEDNIK